MILFATLSVLPSWQELASMWPMWLVLAIGLTIFGYAKCREVKIRREYLASKKREAIQWELDTAKKHGWNEVRKEDSGHYDQQAHWNSLRN